MSGAEVSKWADTSMFAAEPSDGSSGPVAYLLGGPSDPLGQIAAAAKMYKGEVVRDLADVTNAERHSYLEQIQKTVLKMPLEAVSLHFMIEGVTRGFTHQMVRQRTAAYAQESTRFAVKEDAATAVAMPPSLTDTLSLDQLVEKDINERLSMGLGLPGSMAKDEFKVGEAIRMHRDNVREEAIRNGGPQAWRLLWDDHMKEMAATYNNLVNDGMPAEDARGSLPTNITTRLNYITNLRSWFDTMAVRVSDQAQFEWRMAAMQMALAMRTYGAKQSYWTTMSKRQYDKWDTEHPDIPILERRFLIAKSDTDGTGYAQVRLSSEWQYVALTNELKPIEFKIGGPAFGADFDRPSRIAERVRAFASQGVPSSEWTAGSVEHGIPPIYPEEWLLDPNSARLSAGMEFDIFGNRVPAGTGWHWSNGQIIRESDGLDIGIPTERKVWPKDFDTESEG